MIDFTFQQDEFVTITNELVPMYQRSEILALIVRNDDTQDEAENLGMLLLGEKSNATFIVPTRNSGDGPTQKTVWSCIKNEVYDLFCGESDMYSEEREQGMATVKGIITIVATATASRFSVSIGLVVGAVTLAVMSALKLGRNAYCEAYKPESSNNAGDRC